MLNVQETTINASIAASHIKLVMNNMSSMKVMAV